MRYTPAFSLLEILIYLMILAILSLSAIKPQINEILGVRAASSHLQMLQKNLNEISYSAFLQKKKIDSNYLANVLNSGQIKDRFFSLELKNNAFLLSINNAKLRMPLKQTPTGSIVITCNPSNEICRKLYHRKQTK